MEYRSIIALPDSFVAIDTETTGLDFEYCDIIEVAAARYENGSLVGSFTSLIQPPPYYSHETQKDEFVPDFITELTGITNEMLESAPTLEDVFPKLSEFVSNALLVGQNTAFDMRFLYEAAQGLSLPPLENEFVNISRIARKTFPDQQHYRLPDIASLCGIPFDEAHRALADCELTAKCFLSMRKKILDLMTESDFVELFKKKTKTYSEYINELETNAIDVDEDCPIYGKVVVFTGTLDKMPRKDALSLVAKLGGVPSNELTKATNFLVVGNGEFVASVKDGKTKKMEKAEKYAAKGCNICVISENTFFEMLDM